jgi:Ca2+-binding RTX toxin-like protein
MATILDDDTTPVLRYGNSNDTYVVTQANTRIIELPNGGTDLVRANVSFTLGANLENLTLTGTNAINGIGNAGNNVITGNSSNNVLSGLGGVDTVSYATATAGVTVSLALTTPQNTGVAGTDTLTGFENLTGSNFADNLTGSSAANVINGGAGVDIMSGGHRHRQDDAAKRDAGRESRKPRLHRQWQLHRYRQYTEQRHHRRRRK